MKYLTPLILILLLTLSASLSYAQGDDINDPDSTPDPQPLIGVEPDEIDFDPDSTPDPQPLIGVEPDEIDFDPDSTPDPQPLIGVEPDEIDFWSGNEDPMPGMMVNLNLMAPEDNCAAAAPSYLTPNMTVRLHKAIALGEFVGPVLLDYGLVQQFVDSFTDTLKQDAHNLASSAGSLDGEILPEGTLGTTTGAYTCVTFNEGVAMFWEVNVNGSTGWLMESIRWEDVALDLQAQTVDGEIKYGPVIQVKPNGLTVELNALQGDFQVLAVTELSWIEGRFLTPHIFMPEGSLVDGMDIVQDACDGAAPTYLQTGQPATYRTAYNNMGYFASDDLAATDTDFLHFDASVNVSGPVVPSNTSLTGWYGIITGLEEFVNEDVTYPDTAPDGFYRWGLNLNQEIEMVVDGPICNRRTYESSSVVEIFVWYQINVTVNGVSLQNVWLPESVTKVASGGLRLERYLMQQITVLDPPELAPTIGIFQLPGDDTRLITELVDMTTCETLPASRYFAGSRVQPNGFVMNLRSQPYGQPVGRVDANQQFVLVGSPYCWDGIRYWATDMGGWVAENDHDSYFLIPAVVEEVPATVEPLPAEPEPVTPIVTPEPITPTPIPTRPARPTPVPRPTCDPTTGANC